MPNTTYILMPVSSSQKELKWQKTDANKNKLFIKSHFSSNTLLQYVGQTWSPKFTPERKEKKKPKVVGTVAYRD